MRTTRAAIFVALVALGGAVAAQPGAPTQPQQPQSAQPPQPQGSAAPLGVPEGSANAPGAQPPLAPSANATTKPLDLSPKEMEELKAVEDCRGPDIFGVFQFLLTDTCGTQLGVV